MSDRTVASRPQYRVSRDPTGRASLNRGRRRATRGVAATGFTLVELMVSCAIALIIIVGIELVFSISSKTIGAGEILSAINRDDRAAQAVFNTDLLNADLGSDCPAFMIRSSQAYAFESASDKAGAVQPGNPSYDPAFATTSGIIPITYYNYRNHRIDRLAFFARNFFGRQTGGNDTNNSQFVSPTTSNEAYIWYGHVAQPNNAYIAAVTNGTSGGNFYEPGDTTAGNDNNSNATDWILGRVAMLLVPTPVGDSYIKIPNTSNPSSSLDPLILWPPASASVSADGTSARLFQSRYDQASTSIAAYGQALNANQGSNSPYYSWLNGAYSSKGASWYESLIGGQPSPSSPLATGRFQAIPFPIKVASGAGPGGTSGLINSSLAKTSPIFIRGCTQFIVEYAGDFYTKTSTTDPTPVVTNGASRPDPTGQLDFVYVGGIKQVRWYGFPRKMTGASPSTIYPTLTSTDVVPLGTFLVANATGITALPSFERYYPSAWGTAGMTTSTDVTSALANVVTNNPGKPPEYVAAWGPDTTESLPKMIRITLAMDDPNGNLKTPQWFEYVINLQP